MSAASSPAAAETPVTPLRPPLVLAAGEAPLARADEKAAAQARGAERGRRIFVRAWIFGVTVPPLAVLMGQTLPEGLLMGLLVPCWAFLLPISGLALVSFAALRCTARDAATLMVAMLSLVASIQLLQVAGRIGSEVVLDRHAVALQRIALELEAASPAVQARVEPRERPQAPQPTPAEARAAEAFLARIRAEGYGSAEVRAGLVAFARDAPFGWGAIYATDVREIDSSFLVQEALGCEPFELRHAGGRWYVYYCSYEGYD